MAGWRQVFWGERTSAGVRGRSPTGRLYRAGELTPIYVPDEAGEAVRDLLRCREDVQEDLLRWRHRCVKFLARHGRVYREGRHWTRRHWTWLRQQRFTCPVLARLHQEHVGAVEQLVARVADLDREVAALTTTPSYREPVGWLRCFRGLDTLAAMSLLAELGDCHRFRHPRELMAYLGLVPSEASSGARERRAGRALSFLRK